MASSADLGKRTVLEIRKISDKITLAFCTLASTPDPTFINDQLEVLVRFVVLLFDRMSTEMKANEVWKQLFSQKKQPNR